MSMRSGRNGATKTRSPAAGRALQSDPCRDSGGTYVATHHTQRRGGDSNPRWTDSPYRFSRPAHSTALPPLRWGRPKGSRSWGRSGRPGSAPGREERAQEVGAVLGQEPALDLRAVVE